MILFTLLGDRVRRVDILAYIFVLVGLNFASDPLAQLLDGGVSLSAVGGIVVALCAVGTAVVVRRNPDLLDDGAEPAPVYLHALAALATVAFGLVIVLGMQ